MTPTAIVPLFRITLGLEPDPPRRPVLALLRKAEADLRGAIQRFSEPTLSMGTDQKSRSPSECDSHQYSSLERGSDVPADEASSP